MKKNKLYMIWDDLASLKDLTIALILCVGFMLLGYFTAPEEHPYPLFMGVGGSILGFIISSLMIKTKRQVKEEI